ncbi:MAG: HlyC/CorC family transporter [Candidatus Methanomethylophilaceae archaeon]|nr:HlyC/CorC family transporter [Candidatus Methanomethylophilaceae archaeon]
MDALTIVSILSLIVLVAVSAFFSASETAFTSANRIKLKNLVNEGNRRAERCLALLDDYDRLLTTILIGNNLVNILSSAICTWLFTLLFGPVGVIVATVFMLVVLLILGEVTPKTLAKSNPEAIAMRFSKALSILTVIFKPISTIFIGLSRILSRNKEESPTLTEEELVVMIDEIEGEGTLEKSESDLIKSAIEFDDKQISEILTPRVDVVGIDKNASMEELKDLFISSGFSRIPLFDGTIDKIIGVVYAKDFYQRYFENKDTKIEDLMRPVKFLPETATVAKALTEIQKSMVQMIVVVDSYGGTVGIVSLEDVLEELVGEIWDESDEVQHFIIRESDGSYAVLGDADINDMMTEIGVEFDLEDYDEHTVSGYLQYKLNRIPVKGDRVENDAVKMIVSSVKNRRVRMVHVTVKAPVQGSTSE